MTYVHAKRGDKFLALGRRQGRTPKTASIAALKLLTGKCIAAPLEGDLPIKGLVAAIKSWHLICIETQKPN
jgi:hypothetical protein